MTLKQYCQQCGQPVEVAESMAGRRSDCPHCGRIIEWKPLAAASNRRQIASTIAALLVLAALVYFLLWPSHFGRASPWRTHIFGQYLANLSATIASPAVESTNSTGQKAISPTDHSATSGTNAPPPLPPVRPSPEMSPEIPTPTTTNPVALRPDAVRLQDDFDARLSAAGAKAGDIQLSLIWNNVNDLDLHCVDPFDQEIYYASPRSLSGGELDVDRNAHSPLTSVPVENIYWPASGAPPGRYQVFVNHYANNGATDPTSFKVRIMVRGRVIVIPGTVAYGGPKQLINQFTLSPP